MRLSLITLVALGAASGLVSFLFHYAHGTSYFSEDPSACANCHVMLTEYDSWQKASHHAVASCTDCHLPSDFVEKYKAKAENGYFHTLAFALHDFREPIRLKPKNAAILQAQCLHCHAELVQHVTSAEPARRDVRCVHCHDSVGHGPSR